MWHVGCCVIWGDGGCGYGAIFDRDGGWAAWLPTRMALSTQGAAFLASPLQRGMFQLQLVWAAKLPTLRQPSLLLRDTCFFDLKNDTRQQQCGDDGAVQPNLLKIVFA